MKKTLLLVLSMVALFVCIFALNIGAETILKQQDSNEYGELSLFDESVTVGRTNTKYGFSPYIDAEGTTYARIVVGDGTTFYTFPTAYALSNSSIWGDDSHGTIYVLDLTSLNTAMEAQTGTNPDWTYKSVYRIEMPYRVTYLNGGNNQAFKEYSNVVEIYLQPNTTTKDSNKQMLLFWNCKNLETIHNLDTFVFKAGVSGGAFQNDAKLTNLTIGVSPDMTTTQDTMFSGCTNLQSVNFKEAFPNLTTVGKQCFYQCTNLVSTSSEEGAIALPDEVTTINENAFYQCKAMKYLSLPASLTYVGATAFNSCTSLEFVDFNDNPNDIEFYNYGHFSGCTALKAVSLSDGITVLNNRMFTSCTSLQAVYLPASLEQMNTNGNGAGVFCFSSKMYFVQEPFEVRDANGNFLGDSFVMPEKPEVYYMPTNLSRAEGNVSSGTWFRGCSALNKTIVMPESFTNSTVIQMFRETASASNPKNVVYLGDMQDYAWGERNHYINFIFANPNDTDISSVNITKFETTNNTNAYFYFCSTGKRYTMFASSVDAVTLTENTYNHIENPRATVIVEADCVTNASTATYCFCGATISSVEIENSALGHDFENGELVYVFGTLYENVKTCTACAREGCQEQANEIVIDPVIVEKGYSTSNINGIRSFTRGYVVNKELLGIYEEQKGVSVEIGFAFALESKYAPEGDATLSDFPINMKLKESGTALDVQNLDYIMRYKNDSYLETNVVIAGYVLENGVVTFDEIEIVSYRSLAGYVETAEGEDGSLDVSVSIGDLIGGN